MTCSSCATDLGVPLKVLAFLFFHNVQPKRKNKESKPRQIDLGKHLLESVHHSMMSLSSTSTRSCKWNLLRPDAHTSLLKDAAKDDVIYRFYRLVADDASVALL
jgi:hypothetical protein